MRLTFGGRPAPAQLRGSLASLRCTTGLEGADRLEVALANEGLRWLDSPLFGLDTEVGLALGYAPDQLTRVFTGEVVGTQATFPSGGMPMLTVVAQDRRTRLQRSAPARWFGIPIPKIGIMPIPDPVVAPLLGLEHGLLPELDPVGGLIAAALGAAEAMAAVDDPGMRQRIVRRQHDQTTYEFLEQIARENGLSVRIDHLAEPAGYVMHIFSPAAMLEPDVTLRYGQSLIEFRPKVSTVGQIGGIAVRVWRPEIKLELTVTLSFDWDRQSLDIQITPGFGIPTGSSSAIEIVKEPVTPLSAARLLIGKLIPKLNKRLTAEGSCLGEPKLVAGAVLRIEGVGETFGGLYRIVSVTHTLDTNGYRSAFELQKEIWFGSIPAASQGAVRINGGLLTLGAPGA
jgi:hypothetical protein